MTDGLRGVRGCMLFLVLAAIAQSGTGVATKASDDKGEAKKHFERGKQLIENNCIDCMDGSQAGLEGGIGEIEAALHAGYDDRKTAYKLLSDAYAGMITYTEKNQEESKAYEAKRARTDRKLLELDPNDPDVLDRYVTTLQNDPEKIEVLRRLVKIDPNPDRKFNLGYLLLKQRKVNEGMRLVRSAIETDEDAESTLNHVMTLISQLQEVGCPLPGAVEWGKKINAAFDQATTGPGNPRALPEFKTGFLAAVDQNKCAGS